MSDNQLIFDYLLNHPGYHNAIQLHHTLKPGCVNWALRSRISNLRDKFRLNREPYIIQKRIGENGCAEYSLIKIQWLIEANGQMVANFS